MSFHSGKGQSQLYQLDQLQRMHLNAADGCMGSIEDMFVDEHDWAVRYLLIDAAARGDRGARLLVPTLAVDEVDANSRTVWVQLTCDQIANSPEFSRENGLSPEYETEFYRYYRWPDHWRPTWRNAEDGQTLFTTTELGRFRVAAGGAAVGEIRGLVIDVGQWRLRYLEAASVAADAGPFLVSPRWITRLQRGGKCIELRLSPEQIAAAPAYDRTRPIAMEYEQRLFAHYGDMA